MLIEKFLLKLFVFCQGFEFSDEYQTQCDLIDNFAWSQWLKWSECPADCDYALEKRTRQCISVDGSSNLCPGTANDYRICADVNCESNIF